MNFLHFKLNWILGFGGRQRKGERSHSSFPPGGKQSWNFIYGLPTYRLSAHILAVGSKADVIGASRYAGARSPLRWRSASMRLHELSVFQQVARSWTNDKWVVGGAQEEGTQFFFCQCSPPVHFIVLFLRRKAFDSLFSLEIMTIALFMQWSIGQAICSMVISMMRACVCTTVYVE